MDLLNFSMKQNSMYCNPSEAKADDYLRNAFQRTFEDVELLSGIILPLPAGYRLPTAEFDSIVICNAGLFLFEVKGWNKCFVGRETVGDSKQWFLRNRNQTVTVVKDPIAQGHEKLMGLKAYIDPRIAIRYYVLLPEGGVELDPTLPAGVITAQDLPYIPRLLRSQAKASKTTTVMDGDLVRSLARHIRQMAARSSMADHIESCQKFHDSRRKTIADSQAALCI